MSWHCFLSCGRNLDWFFSLPFVNCREVLYCRYSSISSACHAPPVSLRTCLMGYCLWWRASACIVVIPSRLATLPPSSSLVPVVLSLWLTFIGGKSKMRACWLWIFLGFLLLLLLVLAALGAYSRVYLSQHFLSDVCMGSVIGFITPCLMFYFGRQSILKLKSSDIK